MVQPIINTRRPKGFEGLKKYLMDGDKIIMTDEQRCRVYCLNKYFDCFKNKRCHLKQNRDRIDECKQEYKDCMQYSKEMMQRIKEEDFIPTGDILGFK